MDFLTQLFSDLLVRDSWLVLLFLLGALLIGFITAWLYWRRKWKAVNNELNLRTNELNTLRTKYDDLTATLELKEADLKRANLEIEEFTNKNRLLEEEKGRLHGELFGVRQDFDNLTTEKLALVDKEQGYLTKLEDYDNQILGLKTKYQALSEQSAQDANALQELVQMQSKYNAISSKLALVEKENVNLNQQLTESTALSQSYVDYDDLKERMGTISQENEMLKLKLNEVKNINESREDYDGLKVKISDLSEENADLKRRLASMTTQLEAEKNKPPVVMAAPTPVVETEEVEVSKEEKAAKAQADVKAALGSKIKMATADEKDDLKLINGVGPFIEKKLNNLGIYTFEQISQFDGDLIEQVTDAIQFFPGRIERDDWVGQAKVLLGKKNAGTLGAGKKKRPKQDDLKIVEGIGPKIEGLLKDGGINTWAELAASPVSRLQEILTAAGDRYRMHKPDTWPQQAGLAASGKWDELDKLQDELNGGKVV